MQRLLVALAVTGSRADNGIFVESQKLVGWGQQQSSEASFVQQQGGQHAHHRRHREVSHTMVGQPAPPSAGKSVKDMKFSGPFVGNGISGFNDLESFQGLSGEECVQKCNDNPRCRSVDFGARGKVTGECWLSSANKKSAGAAYNPWPDYDFYEAPKGKVAASEGLDPVPLSRTTKSGKTPVGVLPCIAYVHDRLAHGYNGAGFLKEMGAMCEPAIGTGIAQPAYVNACNKVKQITAGYASDMGNVDVTAYCTTIMDAFQSFGPGYTG